MHLRTTIVFSMVVDFLGKISSHLECTTIMRRNILPRNGYNGTQEQATVIQGNEWQSQHCTKRGLCTTVHAHKTRYSHYIMHETWNNNVSNNFAHQWIWSLHFCQWHISLFVTTMTMCKHTLYYFQHVEWKNSSPSCSRGRKQGLCEAFGPCVRSRPRGSGQCELQYERCYCYTCSLCSLVDYYVQYVWCTFRFCIWSNTIICL